MRHYILLFITVITIYSCSDMVEMKEADLKKYPWLTSFLTIEIKDFEGAHNVDIGAIRFSFKAPPKRGNDFFTKIDSIAISENWTLVGSSVTSREYSKMLNQFQTDIEQTFVKIDVDTTENRIRFYVE